MRVLVTGSAGYIGARLVPYLRERGHSVITYDIVDGRDIRDLADLRANLEGQEAVIHLASISSDTACQRYEDLARSVNVDAVLPLLLAAKDAGVSKFIYTSSAAVYGSTDEPATEDYPLRPTTIYAAQKAHAEVLVLHHWPDPIILRPAAVCGVSPRMRFDTPINMMTNHAIRTGVIKVHGGKQRRPSVHIMDLMAVLSFMLTVDTSGVFNVGRQNLEIEGAAQLVSCTLESLGVRSELKIEPRADDRSYQIDSSKLRDLFGLFYGVEHAVQDLYREFRAGKWLDSLSPKYLNVEQWATQR